MAFKDLIFSRLIHKECRIFNIGKVYYSYFLFGNFHAYMITPTIAVGPTSFNRDIDESCNLLDLFKHYILSNVD